MKNYYKGVVAFIDAYWRMIHQAAGWKAMRYWLLVSDPRLGIVVGEFNSALVTAYTEIPEWKRGC
jgi:hypothetical protein